MGRVFTVWTVEPGPFCLIALAAALYLWGVVRLRHRGDTWSRGRTVAFLSGLAIATLAVLSGLAAYDETLIWTHMVQHMLLSITAPVFLALGAPITLLLRTLPARGRRIVRGVLHSRPARVLAFPLTGFVVFVASPYL